MKPNVHPSEGGARPLGHGASGLRASMVPDGPVVNPNLARLTGLTQSQVQNLTPDLVAARGYAALKVNNLTILGAGTGQPNSASLGWQSYQCDRPVVLVPMDQPDGVLLYRPHDQGHERSLTANDGERYCYRSTSRGVCYFDHPGTWFYKYTGATTHMIRCMVLDASDPNTAARFINGPGCHTVSAPASSTISGAANVPGTIVPQNADRRAIIVQNASAAGVNLAVGINGIVTPTTGIILTPYGTLTLEGSLCWQGPISVVAAAGWTCNWMEFE